MKQELTARQAVVLDAIRSFIERRGYSPTTRELADTLGTAQSAVHRSLVGLRALGIVSWEEGQARTLRVLEATDRSEHSAAG